MNYSMCGTENAKTKGDHSVILVPIPDTANYQKADNNLRYELEQVFIVNYLNVSPTFY